jgi:hypothetical protein
LRKSSNAEYGNVNMMNEIDMVKSMMVICFSLLDLAYVVEKRTRFTPPAIAALFGSHLRSLPFEPFLLFDINEGFFNGFMGSFSPAGSLLALLLNR